MGYKSFNKISEMHFNRIFYINLFLIQDIPFIQGNYHHGEEKFLRFLSHHLYYDEGIVSLQLFIRIN